MRMNKNKDFGEWNSKSIVNTFRTLTAITFHSTSIINISAFGTLPVFRSRYKIFRRARLITFFTVFTPIVIRKGTFTAKPIMRRIRVFTMSLLWPRSRSWFRLVATWLNSGRVRIAYRIIWRHLHHDRL